MCWVKYHEFYAVVPAADGGTMIRPVPFQLVSVARPTRRDTPASQPADGQWSPSRQDLIRASYHVMSVGWGLLVSVHAEETLYWAYLIGSIRDRSSESWFSSIYFKVWLGSVVTVSSMFSHCLCQTDERPYRWRSA